MSRSLFHGTTERKRHHRRGAATASTADDHQQSRKPTESKYHSRVAPRPSPGAILMLVIFCTVLVLVFNQITIAVYYENEFMIVTETGMSGQKQRQQDGMSSLRRGTSAAAATSPKESVRVALSRSVTNNRDAQDYAPKLFESIELGEGDSSTATVFTFFDERIDKPLQDKDETLERFFGSLRKTGYRVCSIAHGLAFPPLNENCSPDA